MSIVIRVCLFCIFVYYRIRLRDCVIELQTLMYLLIFRYFIENVFVFLISDSITAKSYYFNTSCIKAIKTNDI